MQIQCSHLTIHLNKERQDLSNIFSHWSKTRPGTFHPPSPGVQCSRWSLVGEYTGSNQTFPVTIRPEFPRLLISCFIRYFIHLLLPNYVAESWNSRMIYTFSGYVNLCGLNKSRIGYLNVQKIFGFEKILLLQKTTKLIQATSVVHCFLMTPVTTNLEYQATSNWIWVWVTRGGVHNHWGIWAQQPAA